MLNLMVGFMKIYCHSESCHDRAKTLLIFGYVTNPICAWYDALAIAEESEL